MKKPGIRLIPILMAALMLLSGCSDTMYAMTPEQQDELAFYAANVIGRHNKRQNLGTWPVVMKPEKPKKEETKEEEEEAQAQDGTAGSQNASTTGENAALTDVIAIPGVSFSYKNASISQTFGTDAYEVNPQPGNAFLSVVFTARNTTEAPIECNISSRSLTFIANLGGVDSAVERTIIDNDLTTFKGSLNPGESKDLVLLFQFPSQVASGDLSGMTIIVVKDGVRHKVTL